MKYKFKSGYPTEQHKRAAEKFVEIFNKDPRVMAILLTCSCARGKASPSSCLDLDLVIKNYKDEFALEKKFQKFYKKEQEFRELVKLDKFTHIDFNITDGKIKPKRRGWTTGPDEFELEIGNTFVYVDVLFDRKGYFKKLSKKYLPYYNKKLRKKKLAEAKMFCLNDIDHIEPYVKRGLYFQAFDRLYKASQEFMQALFISKKIYPIAYDKWVKEQFVNVLGRSDLYQDMVSFREIKKLESNELIKKAERLRYLVKKEIK